MSLALPVFDEALDLGAIELEHPDLSAMDGPPGGVLLCLERHIGSNSHHVAAGQRGCDLDAGAPRAAEEVEHPRTDLIRTHQPHSNAWMLIDQGRQAQRHDLVDVARAGGLLHRRRAGIEIARNERQWILAGGFGRMAEAGPRQAAKQEDTGVASHVSPSRSAPEARSTTDYWRPATLP